MKTNKPVVQKNDYKMPSWTIYTIKDYYLTSKIHVHHQALNISPWFAPATAKVEAISFPSLSATENTCGQAAHLSSQSLQK